MAEGNLLVYGKTAINPPKQLILVIGRAPNHDHPKLENRVDTYDFEKYSKVGFWNTAFSTISWAYSQHYHEYDCKDMKKDCVKKQTSPILFADAVDKGVPNGQNVNDVIRNTTPQQFKEHFTNIFNHAITQRIKLVIISGWGAEEATNYRTDLYRYARQTLNPICKDLDILVVETRFMFGTNTGIIREKLQEENKTALIANAVHEFLITK